MRRAGHGRPTRANRVAAAALAALALAGATLAAFGHGASKGLHVHVDPSPAAPGSTVVVALDARTALASVRVGIVGSETVVAIEPDPPRRHVEVDVRIPDDARDPVNVHAEAFTTGGDTVRASAVVPLGPRLAVRTESAAFDLAIGSVSAGAVRRSPVPVLVVPHRSR